MPLWILWACYLLWAPWVMMTAGRPGTFELQVGAILGHSIFGGLVYSLFPLASHADGFQSWMFRAILLPLAFGLFGLLFLVPFVAMILWTLKSF